MSGLVDAFGNPVGGQGDDLSPMMVDPNLVALLLHHFHAGCALAGMLANQESADNDPRLLSQAAWMFANTMMGVPAASTADGTHEGVRACRVCGCTESTPCKTSIGPCFWIEPDLCSGCVNSATAETKDQMGVQP